MTITRRQRAKLHRHPRLPPSRRWACSSRRMKRRARSKRASLILRDKGNDDMLKELWKKASNGWSKNELIAMNGQGRLLTRGASFESMRYSLLAGGKRLRPILDGGGRCRRREGNGLPDGGLRPRDDPHVLPDPRRPAGDGQRRLPPRQADEPQGLRRRHGRARRRCAPDARLRGHRAPAAHGPGDSFCVRKSARRPV